MRRAPTPAARPRGKHEDRLQLSQRGHPEQLQFLRATTGRLDLPPDTAYLSDASEDGRPPPLGRTRESPSRSRGGGRARSSQSRSSHGPRRKREGGKARSSSREPPRGEAKARRGPPTRRVAPTSQQAVGEATLRSTAALARHVNRLARQVRKKSTAEKALDEWDDGSDSDTAETYDISGYLKGAGLHAIPIEHIGVHRVIRKMCRLVEKQRRTNKVPFVNPDLKWHIPKWMYGHKASMPTKLKDAEENEAAEYNFTGFAQYATVFWTRAIHQMLAQSLTDHKTFSWDELIHVFLETCRKATENSMAVAIAYTEKRLAELYWRMDANDRAVEPAGFLQYTDENSLRGIITAQQKKSATGEGSAASKEASEAAKASAASAAAAEKAAATAAQLAAKGSGAGKGVAREIARALKGKGRSRGGRGKKKGEKGDKGGKGK